MQIINLYKNKKIKKICCLLFLFFFFFFFFESGLANWAKSVKISSMYPPQKNLIGLEAQNKTFQSYSPHDNMYFSSYMTACIKRPNRKPKMG